MRAHLSVQAPAGTLQGTDDVSDLHEFKVRDRCDDLLEPSHSLRYRRSRISRRGRESPAKSLVVGSAPPALHNANLSSELAGDLIGLAGYRAKVRRDGYRAENS